MIPKLGNSKTGVVFKPALIVIMLAAFVLIPVALIAKAVF